jgi:hypothetical protein
MGDKWPTRSGREMRSLIERLCGPPIRQKGSHCTFTRRDGSNPFTFAYHDSATVSGFIVRRILTVDVGLTVRDARKELR